MITNRGRAPTKRPAVIAQNCVTVDFSLRMAGVYSPQRRTSRLTSRQRTDKPNTRRERVLSSGVGLPSPVDRLSVRLPSRRCPSSILPTFPPRSTPATSVPCRSSTPGNLRYFDVLTFVFSHCKRPLMSTEGPTVTNAGKIRKCRVMYQHSRSSQFSSEK